MRNLCEVDFLLNICWSLLAPPPWWSVAYLLEYRCVQVWIIANRWKQSTVGWFLESLQKTWSLYQPWMLSHFFSFFFFLFFCFSLPNREFPTRLVRPCDQNVPGKIGEVSPAGYTATGKRTRSRPRTKWKVYITDFAWSRVDVEQQKYKRLLLTLNVCYFESS